MSDPAGPRTPDASAGQDAPRQGGPRRRLSRANTVVICRAVLITTGLVTAYYLLPMNRKDTGAAVTLGCGLLAVVVVFAWEVRTIQRSPYPRLKAVEGLAATLPLFLLLFASTYYLLDRSVPGSFSERLTRTDSLYFTLTTFTTVGFGDITARTQTGRVITMLQMTVGLLIVGVAARVLTSAVEAGLRRRHRGRPPGDTG